MKHTMPTTALCLVLAAASAFGQDVDAETKFHRAYEQEVVEGKIADAARVYLDMMRDEKVPERLRAEAKFRFAVTAVLLGRSDEARSYLADLVHDAKTPDGLKARAAEYLDAVKGIGVGSELDKKLQSLVFDLARIDPYVNNVPPVYRDFEVIGKSAVPFLRQLLQHNDAALRRHAFRLLLRMREPGMMQSWTPELHAQVYMNASYVGDLREYLKDLPTERDVFEKKLLALDDKGLDGLLGSDSQPPFSAEFLRAAAARKISPAKLVKLSDAVAYRDEAVQRLRVEWIKSDDAALATPAATSFVRFSKYGIPAFVAPAEILPVVVDRLVGVKLAWQPTSWAATKQSNTTNEYQSWEGFVALTNSVPVATLLDAMDAAIARAVPWNGELLGDPYSSGLVDALAVAIETKKPDGDALVRYAAAVRKWFDAASKSSLPLSTVHARFLLSSLPKPEAESFTTWLFAGPAAARPNEAWLSALPLAYDRPELVGLVATAFRAAPPKTKLVLLQSLGLRADNPNVVEASGQAYARAFLAILPELVRGAAAIDPKQVVPVVPFVAYAAALPTEEARERFLAVAQALADWPDDGMRQSALPKLFGKFGAGTAATGAYWCDVVLPSMDRAMAPLPRGDRQIPLSFAIERLESGPRDAKLREGIAALVMAHIDELPNGSGPVLTRSPDLFPLAAWIPKFQEPRTLRVPPDVADPAVREMTKDVAAVSESVMQFTEQCASPGVKTEVVDRLLRESPLDRLNPLVRYIQFASPQAVEDALARAMTAAPPLDPVVTQCALYLARARPSERLFPAVRLLLASTNSMTVSIGISVAKSLGREELLPALAGSLDSMDPKLRNEAKDAIDSIVALRKLKEEARERAGAGGK